MGVARPYDVKRVPRAQSAWRRYGSFLRALWRASDAPGPIFAQDGIASGLPALIVAAFRPAPAHHPRRGDFAWERAQVSTATRIPSRPSRRTCPSGADLPRARTPALRLPPRRPGHRAEPLLGRVGEDVGRAARPIRVIYNGVHLPKKEEGIASAHGRSLPRGVSCREEFRRA